MPTRKRNGTRDWGFNFATIVQVFAIPIFSGLIYLIVQWVTQGNILNEHAKAIEQNQAGLKEESAAREKNRTDFLDKLGDLNKGIGTLNTNLAVQGQVLNGIKEQLDRGNRR